MVYELLCPPKMALDTFWRCLKLKNLDERKYQFDQMLGSLSLIRVHIMKLIIFRHLKKYP